MIVDPALSLTARAGLALLFAAAALHKGRDLASFTRAVAAYRLAPDALAPILAPALAAAESLLAVLLLVSLLLPGLGPEAGAGAGLLLGVYSAAIAVNLARGRRDLDCGCLGPARRQPLSGWLLARNALLIAGALVAAAAPEPRSLTWVDAVSVLGGAGVLAALWEAAHRLAATGPAPRALRRSP